MSLSKKYILQFFLIIILFLIFIFLNGTVKIFLSIIMATYTVITIFLIKKTKAISIKNRQVTIVMGCLAVIGLTIYYLLGLNFGFAKSDVKFSTWSIIHFILPISVIIISSELIRYRFAMTETKLSKFLSLIAFVLVDLIVYTRLYDIKFLSDFLAIIGLVGFTSISSNLLYEYISPKFGYWPIIIYRLIMGIYSYIIPIVPNVYMFTRIVLRMLYPFAIYVILEYMFVKKNKELESKNLIINCVFIIIIASVSILLTILISCKFNYGIMVIGSESMTGALNKGDSIVFERYDKQEINEGDIIVFTNDRAQIIHRVVDKTKIGQEFIYYTKGDANANIDTGYVEEKDIKGICKLRIKYMGYLTIWLKNAFDKI